MEITSPILTSHTTMWNPWLGFNASHVSDVMFIGLINYGKDGQKVYFTEIICRANNTS